MIPGRARCPRGGLLKGLGSSGASRVQWSRSPNMSMAPPAQAVQQGKLKRLLRSTIHFLCYHLVLTRQSKTVSHAAGFRLIVPPTVFHPRYFAASEFFAAFIARLDLSGRQVADIGTGTGILALAAARAGAGERGRRRHQPKRRDIGQLQCARQRSRRAGHGAMLRPLSRSLARPLFDVILSNPPYFPGRTARPCRPRLARGPALSRHRFAVRAGVGAASNRAALSMSSCRRIPTSTCWARSWTVEPAYGARPRRSAGSASLLIESLIILRAAAY